MESLCVYIVVHAHRARECMHARASNGCDGIDACIRLSSTREETDARDARTATIDIDRIERLSPSRLSRVSIDRFDRRIHRISFIHSFRCDRRDARRKERPEGRRDRRGTRPTRDARSSTRDASVRIARGERGTRVSNARRIESRIHCILNHPPETIARELQCMRRNARNDRVIDEFVLRVNAWVGRCLYGEKTDDRSIERDVTSIETTRFG